MKSFLTLILIVNCLTATTQAGIRSPTSPEEEKWKSCVISDDDAAHHPWLATLHVIKSPGNKTTNQKQEQDVEDTSNVYDWWPVVIINESQLMTCGRTFRSPHSDRKMRILNTEEYQIILPGDKEQEIKISFIKPYPKIGARSDFWMKTEKDSVLIHLATPIQFSQRVRPLCLPKPEEVDLVNVQPGVKTMLSGWQCDFHYAVRDFNSTIYLDTLTAAECNSTWLKQGCFSLDDMVPYEDRTCGKPSSGVAMVDGIRPWAYDPGFCAMKGYYNILTLPVERDEKVYNSTVGKRRILVGMFNGVAQEYKSGPTVYVAQLTANTLEWIANTTECGPLNYTCNDGQCLPHQVKCNGTIECDDGSDEEPCFCRAMNYCEWDYFECGYMGECIPKTAGLGKKEPRECDGVRDCKNGEDELAPLNMGTCPDTPKGNWLESNWTYVIFSAIGTFFFLLAIGGSILRKCAKNKEEYLTEEEESEFRQGAPALWEGEIEACKSRQTTSDGRNIHLRAMLMPFIYEIDKDRIEFGAKRNEGSTAEVFEGRYGGAMVILLTLNKKLCCKKKVMKETFKLLLAELKIMAYVNFIKGGHQNVIKLIGASTTNIRHLDITIVAEYCHFGSVSEYLEKNLTLFENAATPILPHPPLLPNREYISWNSMENVPPAHYVAAAELENTYSVGHTAYLYKWTQEVIEGMCFLATHKIIHGDLAARNIMLDHNLIAKIGDFGLSRQIYYYNMSCEEVHPDTKLPWRWMAPEVIGNFSISTKSDVWSFGVTMWEFFTLGRLPYGGLESTPNFLDQLRFGLRLTKPEYAHPKMFHILKSCWEFFPQSRPTFDELKAEVNNLLHPNEEEMSH